MAGIVGNVAPTHVTTPPEALASDPDQHLRRNGRTVRIGAIGDTHYTMHSGGALQSFFQDVRNHADIFLLCGDLTDHGTPEEAKLLAADLAAVRLPMVAVLGNHDYEAGKSEEIKAILEGAGVEVLDGEAVMIADIGFAGVKGFGGGFDRHMLQPWGEQGIKDYVRAAVDEALKLDSALAKIRTSHRVVLMHYGPVRGTSEGEPPEIFPFLGSSRLEEPVNRYHASLVVHGHVHRGTHEAKTSAGIPVYNVALPLLRRLHQNAPPIKIFEIDIASVTADTVG